MAEETPVEQPAVEVKKVIKEEGEEELFRMRAKLYRWASETNEWKERGLGDMKILKHEMSGKVRVLMRRDQTFKVCCNHYLDPTMQLKDHNGSEKAWIWNAMNDFSDDAGELTVKEELFAIRFKTAEKAQEFKVKFDEGKELNKVVMAEARERVIERLNNLQVVDDDQPEGEDKNGAAAEAGEDKNGAAAEEEEKVENGAAEAPEKGAEEEAPQKEGAEVAKETGSGENAGETPKVATEPAEPKKEESRVDSPEK